MSKGMPSIQSSTLNFLKNLKDNNQRDWFNEQRAEYEKARENFLDFTNSIIAAIFDFDNSLGVVTAKECVFRIYRDVRFSPNKLPYKTNMGAYIAQGGRKSPFAGYYLHIEPGASFLSGGIYMAQPNIMRKVRLDVETYADRFKAIVESEKFKATFVNLGNESYKRIPQGFQNTSPVAEYLKLKHITPIQFQNDDSVLSSDFFREAVQTYSQMKPLVDFINEAIEQE